MPTLQDSFREGLEDFAHGRDDFANIRKSSPPTLDGIGPYGVESRTSFSRGTFEPNQNYFSQALSAFEKGNDVPLEGFLRLVIDDTWMGKRFDELEVRADTYPDRTRLIYELIIVHRGDIAELLGVKRE